MDRKLIFILNDGWPKQYLPGVEKDLKDYVEFFTSPNGGTWDNEKEIILLREQLKNDVINRLKNLSNVNQYLLIVFCGHGEASTDKTIFLELNNSEKISVNEISECTRNTRCLLITDSCRIVNESLLLEKCDKTFSSAKVYSSEMYIKCRELYDSAIGQTPRSLFVLATSANHDECAGEDSYGGYYSQALVSCAKEMIKNHMIIDEEVLPFSYIHSLAALQVVKKTNGKQNPQIYVPRSKQLPFVVIPKHK